MLDSPSFLPSRTGASTALVPILRRIALLAASVGALAGCGGTEPTFEGEVVVCCARDRIDAEPILQSFQEREGIRVVALFEDMATSTTRLASRLESGGERCDVFWNDDPAEAVRLSRAGLFEAYESDAAEKIPERHRDPARLWTGFAARARVVLYDTERISPDLVPVAFDELTDERWQGRFAMARPPGGTTPLHAAVLFAIRGESRARLPFELLLANDVLLLDDDSTAARAVASGELPIAIADIDDAARERARGESVDWLPLDHEGSGPLLIPDTVALVRGGPDPENARKLIDHLLSEETEARLASASGRVPVRPKVPAPPRIAELARSKWLEVEWNEVADMLDPSAAFLRELFAAP